MSRLPDRSEYPLYSEAVKELHGLASSELRRLAMRYADYFYVRQFLHPGRSALSNSALCRLSMIFLSQRSKRSHWLTASMTSCKWNWLLSCSLLCNFSSYPRFPSNFPHTNSMQATCNQCRPLSASKSARIIPSTHPRGVARWPIPSQQLHFPRFLQYARIGKCWSIHAIQRSTETGRLVWGCLGQRRKVSPGRDDQKVPGRK